MFGGLHMDDDDSGLDVTITDTDGSVSLRITASPGMSVWDALGMHTFAAGRIQDGAE